ncbi:MAG: excinuclease ABC subunit UvrC [Planktomarina sp.]|nr:excinuclease ABC subunit UvrC [Planktomarina sp.]
MENKKSPLTGHELIADYLTRLDGSPGVYRMLDVESRVLYVGKAKNLNNRVSNYTRPHGHSSRILRMIRETSSMMFLTTKTETEALLLEQNLIKQLKPKYNVLLRDDKSFPYIFISTDHDFPRLEKHRGAKDRIGYYYGPFASAGAVNRTLNTLQKVFLLRSCGDSEVAAGNRPCLNYHLKRCSGPCGGKISKEDYAVLVRQADDFLTGKSSFVQESLAIQMSAASDAMEFEKAAGLRDRITALTQVQTNQGINPLGVNEADVISLHLEGGQACVQVFFIRANQNWGNQDFYPRVGPDVDAAEVLQAFVGQFYDTKEIPRLLLLSHLPEDLNLMVEALSEKQGRKVNIMVPTRGEKMELVAGASRNARESLGRRLSEVASQTRLLKGIAEIFDLTKPPRRIEVYDNSHIQGTNAVGGMIVSGPDGFLKSQYRKFNIKGADITPGDDFGMMREMLGRRFKRLLKSDPERKLDIWPDLLLIDGGAGQVSAVRSIMQDLGIHDIEMIGVSKGIDRNAGKEEFHRTGKPVMALRKNDPVLYYIQRLRDEAHRFAIGAHRLRRARANLKNPLDGIEGIGPKRKKALLSHFGSGKAVSRANLRDLKAVDGISGSMADIIFKYFQS